MSSTIGQAGATDIVFHIPRPWIPRLEVHDTHLAELGLEWYCNVHT